MRPEGQSCGTCRFAEPNPVAARAAEMTGIAQPPLICCRFPLTTRKRHEDWCGEFELETEGV